MAFGLVFLTAFLLSLILTPLSGRIATQVGVVARPGGRRKHQGLIPKLGGIPLFVAFVVAGGLAYWLLPPPAGTNDAQLLQGVLLGSLVMFIGGLADDYWDLSPRFNFGVQFVAVAVAMFYEVFIERFTNPITGRETPLPLLLVFSLTLLWVVGLVNTINFLDGLDGLAAGVGAIAALMFAWHGYRLGQTTIAAFPVALAGALLGFLGFNFWPARIFLGSAGAYFLGYALATLSILSPAKIATALLVMAVPIMDIAWQIADRLRRGQSPFQGDRGHLHFRLADSGLPTRQIVLGYYAVAVIFGFVAIFAPSGRIKLLILALLSLAILTFMAHLARQRAGKR